MAQWVAMDTSHLIQPIERSITFERRDIPFDDYVFVKEQLREQVEEAVLGLSSDTYREQIPHDAIKLWMSRPSGVTIIHAAYSPDTRPIVLAGGPLDGRTHPSMRLYEFEAPAIDADGQPQMAKYKRHGIDVDEHRWVYVYQGDQ